jgi:transposase InsO family protein
MAHRSARLTVFGRQLLVQRVDILGKTVAVVATELGISRATAYKWLRRYRTEGSAGLSDRSSRPHRSPRSLPRSEVEAILAARIETGYGPHRLAYLTGHPRSTIGDVLGRAGMSRLDHGDKLTGAPVRYVACHPGALLHQDHKKLARVPDGGGHRIHGRAGHRRSGGGTDHFEVLIDDASRVGVVVQVPDERPASAITALEQAAAFYAAQGVHIERVLTDNGSAYRSRAYAAAMDRLARGTSALGRIGLRPTAKPSVSSRRCSPNGPMPGPTVPTPNGYRPCQTGSASITMDVHTPRSTGSCHTRRSSTTYP